MKKLNLLFLSVSFLVSNLIISQNPYASIGKKTKPMLSLSNGTYVEHFENDSIRQVGSVMINMRTEQIIAFVDRKEQAKKNHSITNSRFLSVDPLARTFPFYTPYQYAGNKPINCIDIDGLEEYHANEGQLIGKYGTNTEIRIVDQKYTKLAKALTTDPTMPASEVLNAKLYNTGSTAVFDSPDAAAINWGEKYNGRSIVENTEYNSDIYPVDIDFQQKWTYPTADKGTEFGSGVESPSYQNGKAPESIVNEIGEENIPNIHSHGNYTRGSENFSDKDKETGGNKGKDMYMTSSDGTLKLHTPDMGLDGNNPKVLSKNLPSSSKSGDKRQNSIEPKATNSTKIPK
ncbi:MAG: DUF4329 domain-containing protein [Bacteroidota bacterium]|nr:DUF4329 domain-containing protein [Bacteroidota bacterium]